MIYAWRAPDGLIMLPRRVGGQAGVVALGAAPIGPDHPDFRWWEAHIERREANRRPYGDRFAERRNAPLWDIRPGWPAPRLVHPLYQGSVGGPAELTVEVRSAPNRGIGLAVRGGGLRVGGRPEKHLIHWGTPAGNRTEVEVRRWPWLELARLLVWPVWTDAGGQSTSGEGDFGVLVDEADGAVTLRCSPGDGPPDFDAITAVLTRSSRSA